MMVGMVISVLLSTTLIILITVYTPQLWITQDVNSSMFITGILLRAIGTIFASIALRPNPIAYSVTPL